MTLLVSAVAAGALGLTPDQVSVDLTGADGALDLTVRVLIADLRSVDESTEADDLQARADEKRQHIRGTVSELSGIQINDVTIRLTKTRLRLPILGG
jgi:hypothetical protein